MPKDEHQNVKHQCQKIQSGQQEKPTTLVSSLHRRIAKLRCRMRANNRITNHQSPITNAPTSNKTSEDAMENQAHVARSFHGDHRLTDAASRSETIAHQNVASPSAIAISVSESDTNLLQHCCLRARARAWARAWCGGVAADAASLRIRHNPSTIPSTDLLQSAPLCHPLLP